MTKNKNHSPEISNIRVPVAQVLTGEEQSSPLLRASDEERKGMSSQAIDKIFKETSEEKE